MIELFYPEEAYPKMIPAPRAADVVSSGKDGDVGRIIDPSDQWLPVVETTGEVTAMARRSYCHNGSMLLHPVVHLHIIDREGRVFLQRRSRSKVFLPNRWNYSVGGHVSYGETILEALFRKSQLELGFTEFNPVYLCTHIIENDYEKELVCVFAAVGSSFVLKPNADEIADGRFWTREEIESQLGTGIFTPHFEREYKAISKQLFALL